MDVLIRRVVCDSLSVALVLFGVAFMAGLISEEGSAWFGVLMVLIGAIAGAIGRLLGAVQDLEQELRDNDLYPPRHVQS